MLDLFSGIGGFSLAAEWVWGDDLEIVAFCEIDKYCRKVLNKNFPSVPIYKDIKELDGEAFKDIDLITGGFPCQDISVAGKGAGIEGARSGLWSEMHRLISHIRPRYVIIENVPMLTVRGGTRVISDLAEIGMDAEWQIVGADDVGAWHRRKRIWIVCYPTIDRNTHSTNGGRKVGKIQKRQAPQSSRNRTVREEEIPYPETIPLDSHPSVPGSHRKEVQFHGETELRNQQVSDSGPVGAGVSRSGNDGKETGNVSHTKHDGRYGVQEPEGSGSRIHSQAGQSRAEQSKGSDSGKGRNEDLAHAKGKQSGEQTKSKRRKSISRRSGNSRGDQGKGEKETRKVPHPHRVGEKRDQSQDRQGIGTEQTRQDVPDSLGKRGCSGDTAGKDAEDARQLRGSPPYGYWDTEPDVGRVANGIPSRVDRLKGLGNAIVPQCAIVIMELIKQADAKPQ